MSTNPDSLDRLQLALDELLRALRGGQSDAVLGVEPALAAAVQSLQATSPAAFADDPVALRSRVLRLQLSMFRCQLLGQALGELTSALQPTAGYGRDGHVHAL